MTNPGRRRPKPPAASPLRGAAAATDSAPDAAGAEAAAVEPPQPPPPGTPPIPATVVSTGVAPAPQTLAPYIEHLGPESFPGRLRGLYGGSLWLEPTFDGLQWPYMSHTGVGVSGWFWLNTGYETIKRNLQQLPNSALLLRAGARRVARDADLHARPVLRAGASGAGRQHVPGREFDQRRVQRRDVHDRRSLDSLRSVEQLGREGRPVRGLGGLPPGHGNGPLLVRARRRRHVRRRHEHDPQAGGADAVRRQLHAGPPRRGAGGRIRGAAPLSRRPPAHRASGQAVHRQRAERQRDGRSARRPRWAAGRPSSTTSVGSSSRSPANTRSARRSPRGSCRATIPAEKWTPSSSAIRKAPAHPCSSCSRRWSSSA